MELQLREHQSWVIDALRDGFKAGHRAQLLYAPTGFGKTEVAISLMKATADNYKRSSMILDRIVLVDQTSMRLSKYKIRHGVYQANHWKYDTSERIQVCSAQTLERRNKFPEIDLLIVDECFTGDTPISTPSGLKEISSVRCGDVVYNSVGVGIVEAVSIKPATDLFELEFDDGTITRCTGNHPFFTERGWVKASQMEVGGVSFSEQGLRLLWESIQAQNDDRLRENSFFNELEKLATPVELLKILLEEAEEPNAQSGISFKNEKKVERNQPQTYNAWRERVLASFTAVGVASCAGGRVGSRIVGGNSHGSLQRDLSKSLQGRHSKQGKDDRDRAGWREPRNIGEKSTGQKENRSAYFPRLVNISHIKRESPVPVYNIQVRGHPSYFANGKLVHNCHITRAKITQLIMDNPKLKVIGLTATPFTKGLGAIYSNVVCASTTGALVDKSWLAPLKVFIAKEIDMAGVTKVAGEWSPDQVTERGMQITGDIVQEWIKKTHEVFGRPRKTIVFCAGVAHGADLVQQFANKGYNFVSISYRDNDEYKKAAIEDFAKPDTDIHGLIATDILTRGFDVPDVMVGVSARPFSKSLSSHIQQLGRVMRPCEGKEFALWLCMAKGSKVLTDDGLVDIDKVKMSHKIWDGTNFVNHGGAICNGIQEVITYQGLTATEGHLVHTNEGWRTFGECASKQIRITQTGFGRFEIRLSKDIRSTSFLVGSKTQEIYSCSVRMCNLRIQKLNIFNQFAKWKDKGMSCLQSTYSKISNVVIQQSSSDESKVLLTNMRSISFIRRTRNRVQIFWCKTWDYLDYGKSWTSEVFFGSRAISHAVGQNRSKWSLRTWQPTLAFCGVKPAKQTRESSSSTDAQIQNRLPKYSIFRQHFEAFLLGWDDSRRNNGKVSQAVHKTKREVWDILDCGQHNRFTCEGLLVHNCHSGNYIRFRDDWDQVYEEGVQSLDNKEEKTKKEPTEEDKSESKCPACAALWPKGSDTCHSCGYVKQKKQIEAVAGELIELGTMGKSDKNEKQVFYSELLHMAEQKNYNSNWASHKYREKFGVWPKGLAQVTRIPSLTTMNWVKHKNIAWVKGKNKQRKTA